MKALSDELNMDEINGALAEVQGLGFDLGGLGGKARPRTALALGEDKTSKVAAKVVVEETVSKLYKHVGGGQEVLDVTLDVAGTNELLESIMAAHPAPIHQNKTIKAGKNALQEALEAVDLAMDDEQT